MSTITKEWLQQKISDMEAARDEIPFGLDEDDSNTLAALRIALASLEAEPVYFVEIEDGQDINAGRIEGKNRPDLSLLPDGINHLYAAPPAPVEDTEIQRKAGINDSLCEKYNVESLADFVDWQRNHIAELEAAPPAPVGKGETAVMPDYPGYVMTQRECYLAGKKAGLAGSGNAPVMNDYPETLPCPVSLEPGLKFGKGVATKILLEALQRRANYSAEIEIIKEICGDIKDGDFLAAAKINGSSELVNTAYKLPANTPCKDAPEHIWLQTAGVWPENGEFSELTWCSDNQHPDDTLYVRADVVTGNSPVVPDGLCPCCGRKPLKNKTCSVAGCDGKHVARGFCAMHYAIERKKDPSRLESIRAADKRYRARKAAAPQQEVK